MDKASIDIIFYLFWISLYHSINQKILSLSLGLKKIVRETKVEISESETEETF